MKIRPHNLHKDKASATLMLTFMLAVMAMIFAAGSQSLVRLHREIKLLDQQQVKRLSSAPPHTEATTNSIPK